MNKQLSILAAAVAMSVSASAGAVTIVDWNLAGAPGNQVSQSAFSDAVGVAGGAITRGAGITVSAASNSFSSAGWEGTDSGATGSEYISFGFSVDPGYEVDLDSLYIGTRSSDTAPRTLGLYYSGDNYLGLLHTFNQADGGNFVNTVVDLSILPILTGSVDFRIYEVGNTQADGVGATASTGTFRLTGYFESGVFNRNMQFTGTVAAPIPEADTYAFLALGMGLVGLLARRRKA